MADMTPYQRTIEALDLIQSSLVGPQSNLHYIINTAITEAVEAERAACAEIARDYSVEEEGLAGSWNWTKRIADAIEARALAPNHQSVS